MTEEKSNIPVPVEQIDQADDRSIVEMMTGQAIKDYVYSFKQGSRTIEGLTLAGINEAANRRGNIEVSEITYEEREYSWIAIVKATDTITATSRYGAYEQLKSMGNRPDPFAFTKAIHKAQRNAIKQLLPIAIIKDVLNFYLKGEQPKQASVQETNPKEGNTKRMSYAVAKTLYDPLAKQGITKEILWDYIKNKYNIASSNDMKEQQWAELSAILKGAQTEQQLFDNFVDDIKAYLALLMENTKKKVTQVWDSIESDIKPLTKKDCFEAAQNVYGPSSAWNYEMWDQFGDDLVDWKEEGTYINDLYKKYTYIDDLYKKCKSTTTPDQPENLPTEQTGDSIDISYEEENEGQSEQEILDELN